MDRNKKYSVINSFIIRNLYNQRIPITHIILVSNIARLSVKKMVSSLNWEIIFEESNAFSHIKMKNLKSIFKNLTFGEILE